MVRTLAAGWATIEVHFPDTLTAEDRNLLRAAFYAGAGSVMQMLVDPATVDDAAVVLRGLHQELAEFSAASFDITTHR